MLRTREPAEPVTPAAIKQLEQQLGLALPKAYREFLLAANGGRPERDLVLVPGCVASPYARIHFFFGIGDSVESCDLAWNIEVCSDLPTGFVPIATTEGADIFCLTPSGGVLFWDGREKRGFSLADSFDHFLAQLYRDELSPSFADEGTPSSSS